MVFHVLPEGEQDEDALLDLPYEEVTNEDQPDGEKLDGQQLDEKQPDEEQPYGELPDEDRPDGERLVAIAERDLEENDNVAMFVNARRGGSKILQFNGHRYRKVYKCKNGHRYVCSTSKNCNAFVLVNEDNEITMAYEIHEHKAPTQFVSDTEPSGTWFLIILLIFRYLL